MSSPTLQTQFTQAAVENLANSKNEPEWLREKRLAALKLAEAMPMPDWSRGIRGWWSSTVKELDLDTLTPYAPAGSSLPQLENITVIDPDTDEEITENIAGTLVQYNSEVVKVELSAEAKAAGVIFTSIEQAVQEHPELVQKYFMAAVPAEESKLTALHAALWSGGAFLYVPKGTELEQPFRVIFYSDVPGLALFTHTLVVTEGNCKVKVLEENRSTGTLDEPQSMDSNVVEVFVGNGSLVEYYNPQEWGENVSNFSVKRSMIGRDGLNRWFVGSLGSETTRMNLDNVCVAEGARGEMTGIFCPNHQQHFDIKTISKHSAPHTTGDALLKAALSDASQYGFQGKIRVDKPGKHTDSFLGSHVLYLGADSKADAMPSLDVEANDVRCAHGQTIGMVDEQMIFYLQSRGLSREEATHLIVSGFFAPVIERIPLESVRQRLRQAIDHKMGM